MYYDYFDEKSPLKNSINVHNKFCSSLHNFGEDINFRNFHNNRVFLSCLFVTLYIYPSCVKFGLHYNFGAIERYFIALSNDTNYIN